MELSCLWGGSSLEDFPGLVGEGLERLFHLLVSRCSLSQNSCSDNTWFYVLRKGEHFLIDSGAVVISLCFS